MQVGDFVKRNYKPMMNINFYTDSKANSINPGAKFRVDSVNIYGIYSIFTISNTLGDKYEIEENDLTDAFYIVEFDGLYPKEPTVVKEFVCNCSSLDLFRFGCKCKEYENPDKKLEKLLFGEKRVKKA